GDAQDWLLGPLGQLQETIGAKRTEILTALEAMAVSADEVRSAAARAAHDLLAGTFDLLEGTPLPESEPPIAHVANRDLLLASALSLDPVSFEPREQPTVEQLAPVAFAGDQAWRTAFEKRAERG